MSETSAPGVVINDTGQGVCQSNYAVRLLPIYLPVPQKDTCVADTDCQVHIPAFFMGEGRGAPFTRGCHGGPFLQRVGCFLGDLGARSSSATLCPTHLQSSGCFMPYHHDGTINLAILAFKQSSSSLSHALGGLSSSSFLL